MGLTDSAREIKVFLVIPLIFNVHKIFQEQFRCLCNVSY